MFSIKLGECFKEEYSILWEVSKSLPSADIKVCRGWQTFDMLNALHICNKLNLSTCSYVQILEMCISFIFHVVGNSNFLLHGNVLQGYVLACNEKC